MKALRKFFERIKMAGFQNVCVCGHTVSSNLPCCPHCGRSMTVNYFRNLD